jgi:5-methylcytosine-specific restriction protein A
MGEKRSIFKFCLSKSEAIARSSLLTEQLTDGQSEEVFTPDSEGQKRVGQHTYYERSPKNRARAIEIHGTKCKACGFDFNEFYGEELAKDYIEIHHTVSISKLEGYAIDPDKDLIPLCSNCHSIVHRDRNRIMPVEELRDIIIKRRNKQE